MDDRARRNMSSPEKENKAEPQASAGGEPPADVVPAAEPAPGEPPREYGGPAGPEPTRFGDWERKGRCVDF